MLLLSLVLVRCASGCNLEASKTDKGLPIETWLDNDSVQALHRIQGIYRADFELSKLTVNYEGDLRELPTSFTPFDYCLGFKDKGCFDEISRLTASRGFFSGKVSNFGFLDVVVSFDGPGAIEEACPMGRITVVRLIQAGSIESPQDRLGTEGLTERE